MSHPNHIKIRRVLKPPETSINPFLGVSVREMAKRTGLDKGYLSRVKNGKITITQERYEFLEMVWQEIYTAEQKTLEGNHQRKTITLVEKDKL